MKKVLDLANYKGKVLQGTVVTSGTMQKTIVVRVDRRITHPLYEKIIRKFSKFHVHDENQECNVGDKVNIKESRPISKTKSWVLLNVIEKAAAEGVNL